MSKVKALVLLSGGLDSMLAAKILMEQGIDVTGICFTSNFFSCNKAKEAAKNLEIDLKVVDISKEVLELVKNPPSGYGKNLNPCIDCHALMIRSATTKATADKSGKYDFITTGEVLDERPFSQNRQALARVEKLAGVEVLRPLSAKLLPETEIEKQELVNRKRLLDISGRSRARQMELAKKYGLDKYPSPAGGCLLTDPEFSSRLMKMLDYWVDCDTNDIELLKNGRIYWVTTNYGRILIVIGRNKDECEKLEKLKQKADIMVELVEEMGPTTIIRGIRNQKSGIRNLEISVPKELKMSELRLDEEKDQHEIINLASLLTGYYATKAREKKVKLGVRR